MMVQCLGKGLSSVEGVLWVDRLGQSPCSNSSLTWRANRALILYTWNSSSWYPLLNGGLNQWVVYFQRFGGLSSGLRGDVELQTL